MSSPSATLAPLVTAALAAAFGDELRGADPVLRPSAFADVQSNAPLALAKRLGMPPRDVAAKIVDALSAAGIEATCSSVEISGPGFVNFTMSPEWVTAQAAALAADERLGVPVQPSQHIPIDYSAPNVAKEMHVGHLRTTIVGDSLARTLEHLGHDVIRQNHVGDWGTPFGMLIEHLLDVGDDSPEAGLLVSDPNTFYQDAREKFDGLTGDEGFATRARARVVALQAGDTDTLATWERLVGLSKSYFNLVYSTLGVTLTDADLAGESSYNDELAGICDELEAAGIATVSEGALCVFLDGYTGREDKPMPLIIRKSDGGYGYGTTDLATIRHRVRDLHADRILYVVGATQALHFQMVWETARLAGWLPETVTPIHVKIGNVLGSDHKILRTRAGSTLKLMSLLDEAVVNARAVIDASRPDLDDATRAVIAPQIGIGAVKYADLSVAHDSEYVFDLDRMLALTGNTGPYLQYAAARIRSIFRNAGLQLGVARSLQIVEPDERALALKLFDFGSVVVAVGDELEPHRLSGYLFELAQAFSTFYEHCPVLKADTEAQRESRLALCAVTLRVLVQGLDLLGVQSPDQM